MPFLATVLAGYANFLITIILLILANGPTAVLVGLKKSLSTTRNFILVFFSMTYKKSARRTPKSPSISKAMTNHNPLILTPPVLLHLTPSILIILQMAQLQFWSRGKFQCANLPLQTMLLGLARTMPKFG